MSTESSAAGDYFEEAQDLNWGVHGLVGLEYSLSDSLGAVVEVMGRWLTAEPWEGFEDGRLQLVSHLGPLGRLFCLR